MYHFESSLFFGTKSIILVESKIKEVQIVRVFQKNPYMNAKNHTEPYLYSNLPSYLTVSKNSKSSYFAECLHSQKYNEGIHNTFEIFMIIF